MSELDDVKDLYNKGKEDKKNEILKIIEHMKFVEFLTVANTGNEILDCVYKREADMLDELVDKIKNS